MAAFQISDLIEPEEPVTVIATHRKAAAIVALALPILVLSILAAALAKHGYDLGSMLRYNTVFQVTLIPGLFALVWWAMRYWSSATFALMAREQPVTVTGSEISFFGSSYPLDAASCLDVWKGKIRLKDDDLIISQRPLFFIKSKQLRINRYNL